LLQRVEWHPYSSFFPYTTLFRSTLSAIECVLAFRLISESSIRSESIPRFAAGGRSCVAAASLQTAQARRPLETARRMSSCTVLRSEEHTSELQSRETLVCRYRRD